MRAKEELPECPVATAVSLIGGKWKLLILRNLKERPWRFNELHEKLSLTGAEISLNELPAGANVPFVHSHKENEEIMGTSADYRFLESRERLCQKACCISDLHDGRCCQMLCWKRKGIS